MPDPSEKSVARKKTFDRDSVKNTLIVAIGLSLVCSVLVASTAVILKPIQELNELRFRQRIIVEVAGLMQPGADIEKLLERIEPRMVELATGEYVESPAPGDFDALAAANDPDLSVAIPPELDLANIRRRAIYAPVQLVREDDEIEQIILPVHGSGLWSTIYGYLALAGDGTTVTGLQFYAHAETPGLGDKIDDPDWRSQWVGKRIHDDEGMPRIEVIRGFVQTGGDSPDAQFQIDGLSGATLTGRGVTNLVRYWTGPHGFGPYLEQFRQTEGG